MNTVTITYYNIEQKAPNSSEGIGVWGWTCITRHDKMTDRAEAEAQMAEDKASFDTYLEREHRRAPSLETESHIADLQANVEFRIVEDVREFTHVSQYGYSDVHAYEIIKVISDKTIEIRAMTAKHDISHLKQYVGGFSGHVENQRNQKVSYESDLTAPVIRIRKKKNNPESWASNGQRFGLTEAPYAFYDFNF